MLAQSSSVPPGDPFIKDTTSTAFREDVIAESMKQPVLVDFWAPWCGPCKQLTPLLEKAVRAAKGKVKLVKMDIEAHPGIAGQLGVQSIPAIIAFTKGQPVDGFMGALPESQIKGFIERIAGPSTDDREDRLQLAATLAKAGDIVGAAGLYAQILAQEPDYIPAIAALAGLKLDLGDTEGAKAFLASLPPGTESDPVLHSLYAAIDLAEQADGLDDVSGLERRISEDPADHQARFDLAIALNAKGRRLEAAQPLLDIVKRDRGWNEDGARKQLLQFFEAWGPMDAATLEGRRRLSSLLFA